MHTPFSRLPLYLFSIATLIFAGCDVSDPNTPLPAADQSPSNEHDHRMTPKADLGLDRSCHWDCFEEGPRCIAGEVWQFFRAALPCGDMPVGRPECAARDTPEHRCEEGCGEPDQRYASCIEDTRSSILPAHYRLLCAESPHEAGDACKTDDDCRPSAEAAGRLSCDTTTGRCVAQARPIGPADYGLPCGVDLKPSTALDPGDGLVTGIESASPDAATHCIWAVPEKGECIPQAKTITCEFDEDCPVNSICVCLPDPSPIAVCAKTASRHFTTDWLTCP